MPAEERKGRKVYASQKAVCIKESCSFQSVKRVGIRAEFKFNKMNVPILEKDLSRIKVVRLAWDRARKDSIRAALVWVEEPVPSGKTHSEIVQEIFSGTSIPCSRSLSFRQASIPIMSHICLC
eukprot:1141950-Pelagomonas_calceolata.AAC.5